MNKSPRSNLSNPYLKENLNKSSGSHLNTLIITKGIKSDKKVSFNETSFHFPFSYCREKKRLIFTEETTTEPKKKSQQIFSQRLQTTNYKK